jgi:hypothetical protein
MSKVVLVRISLTVRHVQGCPSQNIFNSASCPGLSWSVAKIQRKPWCLGTYAGVDSPYVHSKVDSNTFTMGNPMSESTYSPMPESTFIPQPGWIWPRNIFNSASCPRLFWSEYWSCVLLFFPSFLTVYVCVCVQ